MTNWLPELQQRINSHVATMTPQSTWPPAKFLEMHESKSFCLSLQFCVNDWCAPKCECHRSWLSLPFIKVGHYFILFWLVDLIAIEHLIFEITRCRWGMKTIANYCEWWKTYFSWRFDVQMFVFHFIALQPSWLYKLKYIGFIYVGETYSCCRC